jgi:hypothetical protein
MISFDLLCKNETITSYIWDNHRLIFSTYVKDNYKIFSCTTREILFHQQIHKYISFGYFKEKSCLINTLTFPKGKKIPNDLSININDWANIDNKIGLDFKKEIITKTLCPNNILVTVKLHYGPYELAENLLPKFLNKQICKLNKKQILIHNYTTCNTRIFNVEGIPKMVTVSPDDSLTAVFTDKKIFFFDNG